MSGGLKSARVISETNEPPHLRSSQPIVRPPEKRRGSDNVAQVEGRWGALAVVVQVRQRSVVIPREQFC